MLVTVPVPVTRIVTRIVTVIVTLTLTVTVTVPSTFARVSYLPLEDTERFNRARLDIPVVREFLVVGPVLFLECAGIVDNSAIAKLGAAVVHPHQSAAVNIPTAKQRDPLAKQTFETLAANFFDNPFHVFLL